MRLNLLHIERVICFCFCCPVCVLCISCSLRPLDVEFMKALHEKVNIVPILAKADTLTPSEVKKKKIKARLMSITNC